MFIDYFEIPNDIRIFYKVYGSTDESNRKIDPQQQTLIFLHGGPGVVDHTLYEAYWSKFSKKNLSGLPLQVIFIDHRGSGRSYYVNDGVKDYGDKSLWTLDQWGKDVHSFFSAFEIEKPILAGVSFGGFVAMSCATQYPSKLGGLILCDTDAQFNLDEVLAHFAQKVRDKGHDETRVTEVCSVAKKMFSNTNAETYAEYVRTCIPYCATKPYEPKMIANCVTNPEVAYIFNNRELTHFNFLPHLHSVECPILILTGDQNPVHTLASAKRTAGVIPSDRLSYRLFKGAGSPVYRDCETAVTDTINSYLDSLPAPKHQGVMRLISKL